MPSRNLLNTVFTGCGPYPFAPEDLSKGACINQRKHTVSFSKCLPVSQLLILLMPAILMDGQLLYSRFLHTAMALSADCTSIQGSESAQSCCCPWQQHPDPQDCATHGLVQA